MCHDNHEHMFQSDQSWSRITADSLWSSHCFAPIRMGVFIMGVGVGVTELLSVYVLQCDGKR